MILRDSIRPLDAAGRELATIRAHVGTAEAAVTLETSGRGQRYELVSEVRAIIYPSPHAVAGSRWRWRGRVYVCEAGPVVRRRGNRDHHFTLTLTLEN